jgi:hypothetical protein
MFLSLRKAPAKKAGSRSDKKSIKLIGLRCGRVAQLGERIVRNDEAGGSSPPTSTKFLFKVAPNRARATVLPQVACRWIQLPCLPFPTLPA